MAKELSPEEKQKLLYKEINIWKEEFRKHDFKLCVYSLFTFSLLALASIVLLYINSLIASVAIIITTIYLGLVVIPNILAWNQIKKCNTNNIHNFKLGVIRQKYYRQRKFSLFVVKLEDIEKEARIHCTEEQFSRIKLDDRIVYFEFLSGEYGIIKLPYGINDEDLELLENNLYTPTDKDLYSFSQFRKGVTIYDNFLVYCVLIIIVVFGLVIGIRTKNYIYLAFFMFLSLGLACIAYDILIAPNKPYTVGEFDNCFKATVIKKTREGKNSIRKYYYGKTYYYINVKNANGEERNRIRVLRSTYNELKEGDSVICFEYKKPDFQIGNIAAVKNIN